MLGCSCDTFQRKIVFYIWEGDVRLSINVIIISWGALALTKAASFRAASGSVVNIFLLLERGVLQAIFGFGI